jgi:hypothetical protein
MGAGDGCGVNLIVLTLLEGVCVLLVNSAILQAP